MVRCVRIDFRFWCKNESKNGARGWVQAWCKNESKN